MNDSEDDYPRQYICHHLKPHTIVINDITDAWADFLLHQRGWYDYWCLACAPNWLLERLYKDAEKVTGFYKYFNEVAQS